jgi:hypothetical protein
VAPETAEAKAERKRMRRSRHAKAAAWVPPTSAAHRQQQRQLAWQARCKEVDQAAAEEAAVAEAALERAGNAAEAAVAAELAE